MKLCVIMKEVRYNVYLNKGVISLIQAKIILINKANRVKMKDSEVLELVECY